MFDIFGKVNMPNNLLQISINVSKWTLFAVGAIYATNRILQWTRRCRCKGRLDGKIVVITGGNSGIGKTTAQILASKGATVILACRNFGRGYKVAREIIRSTGNNKVSVIELDVSSFRSLKKFSKTMRDNFAHFDILINNAGVFFLRSNLMSENGYNLTMATNYIGPMYLLFLLLDMLKENPPSRIINVSSHGYALAKSVRKSDFYDSGTIEKMEIYGKSKLAMNLGSIYLSRCLSKHGITVNFMTPGDVCSGILRYYEDGFFTRICVCFIKFLLFKTSHEGVQTIVHLALCDKFDTVTGKYYVNCKESELEEYSRNEEAVQSLWEATRQVLESEGLIGYMNQMH